jgi:hypothetical protein
MVQLEITLSRAHKIAERLKTKAADMSAESEKLAASAHVAGKTGAGQVARLAAQGVKAMELADGSERVMRAVAFVRAEIAKENQKRGINQLLGLSDAVNRTITARKSLLEHAKDGSIGHDELEQYKPLKEESSYGSGAVRINVFTDAQRAQIESQLAVLQRESFALADRVAEANAGRFALSLDEDIAAMATGA